MRKIALCVAVISLAACDQSRSTADVAEWAEDQSASNADQITQMESRIAALEAEVERLAGEQSKDIDMLRDITAADAADGREVSAELSRLSGNDKAFLAQINFLRARQGLSPMPQI